MKAKLTILISILWLQSFPQTIDTLFYERFETGGSSFNLNTTDLGSAGSTSGVNQWIINNQYAGGSGSIICLGFPFTFNIVNTPDQPPLITGNANSNYLHVISDAAQTSGINNCNYIAADGICTLNENNFAGMSADINTTGYDTVKISFMWLCAGGTNIYGELYYSIDSGTNWIQIANPITQYRSQPLWITQPIADAAFAGHNTFRIGYRFVNQNSGSAADPGFAIDEVLITGTVSAPPPVAAFNVSDSTLCGSGCVDFTDISSGNPTSWFWIFQGAATAFSTQQNPTGICYNNPGTYDVTLIAGNTSGSDTLTLPAVTVNVLPPVPVITFSNDTLFTTGGYTGYQWFLNGNLISGANDSLYVVLNDGAYTVSITDSNGCESVSDSLNYVTGINEYQEEVLYLYPNPVNDILIMELPDQIVSLKIYDHAGREVRDLRGRKIPEKLNMSKLNAGVYHFTFTTSDGRIITRNVVKRQ